MSYETPIKHAPKVTLHNGSSCIPQHYLTFSHTLESVEEVVADIEFDANFPVFVYQNGACIFLQVGIVGFDNYKSLIAQSNKKIVYGRKWRIEHELPTSEIIQTTFLALKTAREHEVRELFRLKLENKLVTPFNSHHDLPLMANNAELVAMANDSNSTLGCPASINNILRKISFNYAQVNAKSVTQYGSKWLVDLEVIPGKRTYLPEIKKHEFTLIFSSLHANALYYQLIKYFIDLSDKYVQETFTYRGFKRFSEQVCVEGLGRLSAHIRNKDHYADHDDFSTELAQSNYYTDTKRVPPLTNGPNSKRVKKTLQTIGKLSGISPKPTNCF